MRKSNVFSRKLLSIPYAAFLVLFVIIPLFLIIGYAFTDDAGRITLSNFIAFFSGGHNINTLTYSISIALLNTFICLLLGYPAAYFLSKRELGFGKAMVLLFIMPMWINFVLRTAATRDLLFAIGLNGGEHPYISTMIGMVYNYLPFVILPLYTTMTKLDRSLIEAAYDLGANKPRMFFSTLLPMTMPGIMSASTMVFMPTMSSYVISDVMGERKISLIGNSIQLYFDQGLWHIGSLVALVMLVIMLFVSFCTDMGDEKETRGGLW